MPGPTRQPHPAQPDCSPALGDGSRPGASSGMARTPRTGPSQPGPDPLAPLAMPWSPTASSGTRSEGPRGCLPSAEPVKLNETSGGWIYPTGLLGLDGGAGLVDPHLGWQGRG